MLSACLRARLADLVKPMELHFTAETEKKLKDLAALSGQDADDIVEDATVAYIEQALRLQGTLDANLCTASSE